MKFDSDQPLVSVLMTAYNREKYIGEAIESVLASTYKNFELIIVDDSSGDKTVAIARDYEKKDNRVKVYVNERNLRDYPNRNRAAGYAQGKYIKYLDSDDAIYNWGLEYCVEMMEKYPMAGIGMTYRSNKIEKDCLESKDIIRYNFFEDGILNIGPSGTILKAESFRNNGYFDADYGPASDMYFNLKIAAHYPVVLLKRSFVFYRVHEGQEINNAYSYLSNNYRYIIAALNLPQFPLTEEEKNIVLKKAKQSFVRSFLVYIKNTGKVLEALKAIRISGIGPGGFILGCIK